MTSTKCALRSLETLRGPFLPFNVNDAPEEPSSLFLQWLNIAIAESVPEPHAMVLSTADSDGFPDARVLILKNVDRCGFHFAISAASRKGRQLTNRPQAALTFYWQKLGRQVRVRGVVVEQGSQASAEDFLARPEGSRAIAILARQSEVLADAGARDAALEASLRRIQAEPGLVSEAWRLYAVRPDEVEFWQGAANRRHERLRYRRADEGYVRERLWP